MLNANEVRVIAFLLGLLLLGSAVKSCRGQARLVPKPESEVMKEVKFRKPRPVQAPD